MLDFHISIASVALFVIILLISLVILLIYLHPSSTHVTTVPGPNVIDKDNGNINDIEFAGSLQQFLNENHKKFGSLVSFYYGKTLVISTSDANHFSPRTQVLQIPGFLFENWKSCVGEDSFLFAQGTEIFSRRNNLQFEISTKLKEKYAQVFNLLTAELVKKWKKQPEGDHIPLTRHMQTLATKSISLLIFGDYFDNDANILKLYKSYEMCWNSVMSKSRNEPTKREEEIIKDTNKLREVVEEAIEFRWNKGDGKLPVIIDKLISASNSALTREQMVSDAITLFVIGMQSTMSVLSWTIFYLIKHKNVQEKLRMKLSEAHSLDIMPESLIDHKYLQSIVKESVRLGGIFSWVGKEQDYDAVFDQKHVVPKQTPIIESIACSLKDESKWNQPEEFNSDRFTKSNDVEGTINPLIYTPFAFATTRKNPQDSLIYLLSAIAVACLVREFEIEAAGDLVDEISYDNFTTMPCSEEVWIKIKQPTVVEDINAVDDDE